MANRLAAALLMLSTFVNLSLGSLYLPRGANLETFYPLVDTVLGFVSMMDDDIF